ncbi:hypothetical protein [Streptomyces canus]|uniref:hypothetical protein n=1 Tax=Streptomyces canus TaxID=58343 RepID=UPI00224E9401|nr:hypothetical protein [Streptomyces canus]MCX4855802.1 hypothetical protein [Streptomyces canus]
MAGLPAPAMRAELARSGLQFVNEHTYNQPMCAGFANAVMPLQIGGGRGASLGPSASGREGLGCHPGSSAPEVGLCEPLSERHVATQED